MILTFNMYFIATFRVYILLGQATKILIFDCRTKVIGAESALQTKGIKDVFVEETIFLYSEE